MSGVAVAEIGAGYEQGHYDDGLRFIPRALGVNTSLGHMTISCNILQGVPSSHIEARLAKLWEESETQSQEAFANIALAELLNWQPASPAVREMLGSQSAIKGEFSIEWAPLEATAG